MPRLILTLRPGASTQSTQATVLNVGGVIDATAARVSNNVVVSVDEITPQIKQELGAIPGVERVWEDRQAFPQVADQKEQDDFLERVKKIRGEKNVPSATGEDDDLETDGGVVTVFKDAEPAEPSPSAAIFGIDDSLAYAGVPSIHENGIRGESVICVNVDTGACKTAIDPSRQLAGADLTGEGDPYQQYGPHGPFTLGIMAGDDHTEGLERGFAPESDVFPIKTTLAGSELVLAQDIIVDLAEATGKWVVVNNSWGFLDCTGGCSFPSTDAIAQSSKHPKVIQVFAAGNQALDCGQGCDGSTVGINGPNSLDNVLSVAASGRNGDTDAMQAYSSRGGPGSVSCGTAKPDLTAPIFGVVPWDCGSKNIGNSGGTSGAAPQVAGAIALMLDAVSETSQATVFDVFRNTSKQFLGVPGHNGCSGYGNMDAASAIDVAPPPVEKSGLSATKMLGGIVAAGFGAAIMRDRLSGR